MIDARGGVVKKQEVIASPDERRLRSLAEGSRQPRPRALTEVICVTTAKNNNNNNSVPNNNDNTVLDTSSISFVSPIRGNGRPAGVVVTPPTPNPITTTTPATQGGTSDVPTTTTSSIQSIEEVRRGLPASPAVTESLNVLNEAKRELLRAQLREGLAYKPKR